MSESIFDDKSVMPDENSLLKALGPTAGYWQDFRKHLRDNYGSLREEWKFYNQKSGWSLKVLLKKRNLFFFIPYKNYFRLVFIFGDKAVSAVETCDLPQDMVETLKNARKYMEGRGLPVDVKSESDLKHIKKLVEIKINN